MKKTLLQLLLLCLPLLSMAQGWPSYYGGVMLQAFYWDSYDDTKWTNLTSRADELSKYFDLIWVPNSGQVKPDEWNHGDGMKAMGYDPCFWLKHNSIWGTQTELVNMIKTYREKGTGIIEDVVINHKKGVYDWADFPVESYTNPTTGKTYNINWSTDKTKMWGITLNDELYTSGTSGYTDDGTGHYDEGDDFSGYRDLDHVNPGVQQNCITYQDFLLNELGYIGFRLDMVKGYKPYYTGMYNAATHPAFSVGEYWDGYSSIVNWIGETALHPTANGQIQSAAFDFPLKNTIKSVFDDYNWDAMSDKGVAGDPNWQRYAVTFVDNHDTGREDYQRLWNNWSAANAFILAMPGTPCIWLPHYDADPTNIGNMILARRAAGVTNQSTITRQERYNNGYILVTQGSKGSVYVQFGDAVNEGCPYGYKEVASGDCYKFYCTYELDLSKDNKPGLSFGYPVVSKGTGSFYQSVTVNVKPSLSGTTLVYTTDGTSPTASSQQVTNLDGQDLTFTESTRLSVGVLQDGVVRNIQSYKYIITQEKATTITVYVKASKSPLYVHAWDGKGDLTTWPGQKLSQTTVIGGTKWYTYTVSKPSDDYSFNMVLSQGSEETKSGDVSGISSDVFYELTSNYAKDLTTRYIEHLYDDEEEEQTVSEPITIYVASSTQPMLHAWNGTGDLNGEWGDNQKMTQTTTIGGKKWYYHTFADDVDVVNIIFHTSSSQTANIEGITRTQFFNYNGSTDYQNVTDDYIANLYFDTPAGVRYERDKVYAYFEDSDDWGQCYAYTYNSETEGNWPGSNANVTKVGETSNGNTIYKWVSTSTTQPGNIIFNKGQSSGTSAGNGQTKDLTFVNGGYYVIDGLKGVVTKQSDLLSRSFAKNTIATVSAPFSLNAAEVEALDGKLYELTDEQNGYLIFSEATTMTALRPYLFVADKGGKAFLQFKDKAIQNGTPVTVTAGNFAFTGTTDTEKLVSNSSTTYYGYSQNNFVQVGTTNGATMRPYRAYFSTTASASARPVDILFGGITTQLSNIKAATVESAAVYDLQGRRVQPNGRLQKGIYILNGKKIILK